MDIKAAQKSIIANTISGDNFDIRGFVAEVQGFSLGLRITHWETKSFALHKATEMIQEAMDGLLDDFVETFVGLRNGNRPTFGGKIEKSTDVDAMIKCLKWMSLRDSSLLNIRDEMLSQCYKFKYLQGLS